MAGRILEPLRVDSADAVSWDDAADVVVVGFGGAGAAAAIEALDSGAEVLAVDRFGGGGATHYSGGVYYAGGGTKHQREAGFDDTPEEMFKYLRAEGTPLDDATLRRFCEGSADELEWVESHGVPFSGAAYLKKTAFPPDPYYLFYSGNEMIPKYKAISRPAPRGHRPATTGFGGHIHFAKLRDAALGKGLRLLPHAPARRLILDRHERVIGVEVNALPEGLWKRHDELYAVVSPWKPLNADRAQKAIEQCDALEAGVDAPRRIRARGGVILCTGGFVNSLDKLREIRPVLAEKYLGIQRLGALGCDGSGIELGQSVGGATDFMDRMFLGRSITPPDAFVYGLIVNSRGERFINEDAYNSIVGNAISAQPDGAMAWLVMDDTLFWRGVKQSLFPGKGMFVAWGLPALINITLGGTKRGGSPAALARKCGIDPAGLERTVAAFNANTGEGATDPLGKSPDKLKKFTGKSWYAVNVSLSNKFSPTWAFTLGGLDVEQDTGLVKDQSGKAIPGLYAAGRAAVGLCSINYNMSGSSVADTVFSGRRAARDAARQAGFNAPG